MPIKPTPNSKSNKNSANSNNKQNKQQRTKCAAAAVQEADQMNRPPRLEDDDNEEDDDDEDDCGSGSGEPSSEETTERSANSIDQTNNHHQANHHNLNENYPYQLSTEQSNVINPITIDDNDRSILFASDVFTSKPIPPPASELEKIIEQATTRRPLPPKKPGHIEIVMLPLPPSESATPKSNFINRIGNKENKKHLSGIQITGGLSPNDINNLDDDLDSNFDSNLNQVYGRESISLVESSDNAGSSNEILGGAIHINRNLIDFKFNKNSADRTALLIAAIAILIIIIVIIAPIVVFIKMRLRMSRNNKLASVMPPIATAQLSPAYQATSKSYASLAASGSMINPLANPGAFASNPNFHSSMHHLGNVMPPNLTLTTNPVYGTIDNKAAKLPNKKDLGKEWYV